MPKAKTKTFEESLARLDGIIAAIDGGEAPLDGVLDLYKEGIALTLFCAERLKTAEAEVTVLTKTLDGAFAERPFVMDEEE